MTDWHRNNQNDWCAIAHKSQRKPILYGRNTSLSDLAIEMKGIKVLFLKSWGLGISKTYPITQKPPAKVVNG